MTHYSDKSVKPRILVVDDDRSIREVLADALKGDFEVYVASSGREAVVKYKKYRPSIVLMDILMPDMNGIEATEKIRKIDKKAKILGISAYSESKGPQLINAGAKEVLPKPVSILSILERIHYYLTHNNCVS
ncbi:MAG: response regulator [Thermoplasmata archaeon]|nr:response regulator [Thermoplasmata archaeon]